MTDSSPDDLALAVKALSAKEARAELLSFLRAHPEEAEAFVRERSKEAPEAYARALRDSLARKVHALSVSIAADEFTPYWEEDKLTDESSYVDDMEVLLLDAAAVLPLETLLEIAMETSQAIAQETVYDWHPDGTDEELVIAPALAFILRAPSQEEEIKARFADFLRHAGEDEDGVSWRLSSLEEKLESRRKPRKRGPARRS